MNPFAALTGGVPITKAMERLNKSCPVFKAVSNDDQDAAAENKDPQAMLPAHLRSDAYSKAVNDFSHDGMHNTSLKPRSYSRNYPVRKHR